MVLATEQGVDGVVALTIGMATYNDFNGVYFTLQALRLYQDLRDTELLVVDNYGCPDTKRLVEGWVHGARYVLATEVRGTAAAKDGVFREAQGEAVLCCDSHVLFAPGAVRRLKEYYREHPDCPDLLQGPLVYDDLKTISTHFEPVWRGEMWGIWQTDPRGQDPEGEPFEIPMQGMGAFSCRKGAWPGFNPMFRGFGWEEGYIHEKVRRAGGRCLCLPWLRWTHRFGRPAGIEYPLTVEEKLRNYVIGHAELGLDPTPVLAHFSEILPEDHVVAVAAEALEGPPQAREPTATSPQEVDAGAAGGGATAPAPLTEGADQILQSPLLKRLPSPLQALSLIVFGPARIGRMARGVGRFAHGARNPVEEFKAEPTAMVDHPQPQAREPTAATPPEVNAGAAGGGAVPLSEGAGQGLPSPLVLASPRRERNNGVELLSGEEHKAMSQEAAYYTPDYFSQIEEGSLASARVMVPILLKLVEVQSVIDIGCGTGAWLSVFRENGIEDIWGVDGPYINRNQLKIPAQQFTSTDLEQPFHMPRNFDLVVALEVAEHLSEGSAETLVNTLTGLGPVVLFSAAIPNQGGANHQNEQWPEYWAKLFNSNGYVASDAIRRRVWTNENVEVWYAQNTLLFVAQEQLQNYPLLRKEYAAYPPSIVHPKLFLAKVEQANRAEAVAAEALGGPQAREEPQAPEPTATTPPEVDAGAAGGGATAPATLTEGADQVLQSPLLKRLPSPLLALSLIVFGPARIGRMARGVGRFAHGARNPVEEFKAEPTAMVDHPQRLPNPPQRQKDLTATRPPTMTSPSDRRVPTAIGDRASRRAIVCFVEDDRHLIQQALALRHSWLYT